MTGVKKASLSSRRVSCWLTPLPLFFALCTLPGAFAKDSLELPSCHLGDQPPVEIGGSLKLCFFLSTSPPKKMVFQIKVDEYAQLVLQGSQAQALTALGASQEASNGSAPVHTWVAASGSESVEPLDCGNVTDVDRRSGRVSCPQIFASSNHVAQVVNLVVNLRDGRISSFAWDNGCQGCGAAECMRSHKSLAIGVGRGGGDTFNQGTCGRGFSGCRQQGLACDLKVLITFAGTDRHGTNALSAGMRLSKFTGYTLASLYQKMNDKYAGMVR